MAALKQSVFVDNLVKSKADAKSFVWNFFGNLVNKADATACTLIAAYKVAK